MKRFLLIFLLFVLSVFTFTTDGEGQLIGSRCDLVVAGVDTELPHVAWPFTVLAPDGTIYIYYSEGTAHRNSDNQRKIMMIRSLDDNGWCGDGYWTAPEEVYSEDGYALDVAGAFIRSDGEMALTAVKRLKVDEKTERRWYPVLKSDNGNYYSFEQATTLGVFPYGNGMTLANGDTLVTGYYGAFNYGGPTGSGILVSEDDGLTFPNDSAVRIFTYDPHASDGWESITFRPSETSVVDLGGGQLLAVTRAFHKKDQDDYDDYYLYQSRSMDYGATWSEKEYLFRGGPAHIARLQNGHLVMCYTFRGSAIPGSTSGGIYCLASKDNGHTWGTAHQIYVNNRYWDFGYPQTVQLADGTLFAVYYANNGEDHMRIQRSRFQEADLQGVAPNRIRTSYFSGSRDWPRGTSIVLSGSRWRETARHWYGVPSGGRLRVSRRHVNWESRPNHRNNDYMYLEVLEPDDYMGVKQTIAGAYNRATRGSSMELRFLAYSAVGSEIYVAVEILGTDKKWVSRRVSRHFLPDNRWRWYTANFDLPMIEGVNEADLRITIGFGDSASGHQSLGIDNVTLRRRQM